MDFVKLNNNQKLVQSKPECLFSFKVVDAWDTRVAAVVPRG